MSVRVDMPRAAGFTLVELLVVLLIMGLFAGLIGATARPDEGKLLELEAERLAQLLDLAADQARLTGKPIAWTSDGAQYRFWQWREGVGWTPARDEALRARPLPAGMRISDLRVEALPSNALRLELAADVALPYDFHVSLGAARYTVTGSPMGEVSAHASP